MQTPRNAGRVRRAPARTRRIARVASALGIAALLGGTGLLAACADAPAAPRAAAASPRASLTGTLTGTLTEPVTVDALLRTTPLASDLTKSFKVGKNGASFDWPEVGLRVGVPSGVAAGMTITVKALKGDVIAYDFGPDGAQFAQALTVSQSLTGTNYALLPLGAILRGAYFKSATQVSDATNTATVDAFQATEVDLLSNRVRFPVTHFSGYMVSWGVD
jgi:hypothetical protein